MCDLNVVKAGGYKSGNMDIFVLKFVENPISKGVVLMEILVTSSGVGKICRLFCVIKQKYWQ